VVAEASSLESAQKIKDAWEKKEHRRTGQAFQKVLEKRVFHAFIVENKLVYPEIIE
jgi:hypothetical protein